MSHAPRKFAQLLVSSMMPSGFAPPDTVSASPARTTGPTRTDDGAHQSSASYTCCSVHSDLHSPCINLGLHVSRAGFGTLRSRTHVCFYILFHLFLPPFTLSRARGRTITRAICRAVIHIPACARCEFRDRVNTATSCMHLMSMVSVDVGARTRAMFIDRASLCIPIRRGSILSSTSAGTDSTTNPVRV
jgi:hypothetical protein